MGILKMNYSAKKWNWMFWRGDNDERETIIYSPGSYDAGIEDYFVVVLFKTESTERDWWLCKFIDSDVLYEDVGYQRIENYGRRLRDAMTTCYAMNKIIGAE